MKKRLILILLSLFFIVSISSCKKNIEEITSTYTDIDNTDFIHYDNYEYEIPKSDNPNGIKVIYDLNNGFKFESKTNMENKILRPNTIPKKIASTFVDWYMDKELNNVFDFDKEIDKETTIYAKYETDYTLLTNYVSNKSIYSSIMVKSIFSDPKMSSSYYESCGSGVIISANENYIYCLTNNHVIYKPDTYKYSEYYIYDCYNNTYDGHVLYNDNKYDLALLYFSKRDNKGNINDNLAPISFSKDLPKQNEKLITLSNPKKIMNVIIYGEYLELKSFKNDKDNLDKSNIDFKVISHSGEIEDGASGSMLLDSNLNLVGINFATQLNSKNEFVYSYAIPYYKIIEFINNYISQK